MRILDGLLVTLAYDILFRGSVLSRPESCLVGTANLAGECCEARFSNIWKPLMKNGKL